MNRSPSRAVCGLLLAAPLLAQSPGAIGYLKRVMDQFHQTLDVYTDPSAAGNHFAARGQLGAAAAVPAMDEAFTDNPRSGLGCIKATFRPRGEKWGGWYFMNGILQGADTQPKENWGKSPNAGVDLQGANRLTFWAKGDKGGERVEFFCFGVGWDPNTQQRSEPFPDSSPKVSSVLTLTNTWKQYPIDLRGANRSYVLGGFGWVTSAEQTSNLEITFYLDDIQYEKQRLDELRFLVSFETIRSFNGFDLVFRNPAFTYDQAVALLAFLAAGERQRATLLADALVYAQDHDRFFDDGRIRNAYQGADLILPSGWIPNGRAATARMPGWYDPGAAQWVEDQVQVGTYTGNVAWAMLALLAYHETYGGSRYLAAAERMGEWVERLCRDTRGAGGYTGGFEGWEPNQTKLLYKATEHNIDLYAVFSRLFRITSNQVWRARAEHAKRFLLAMWDPLEGKFRTGTTTDGVAINRSVIPVDIQAWAVLVLREEDRTYWRGLDYADQRLRVGGGFDFNQDRDAIWYEGTAQMALAFYHTGQTAKYQSTLATLRAAQQPSGGIYAADRDGLTTGLTLPDGQPWLYFRRLHVGATAWLALAESRLNPFWFAAPRVTAVVNGAGFQRGAVAPGSIITLFGAEMAPLTVKAETTPLPTALADTSLLIAGRPAPFFFGSPGQINAHLPYETEPGTATAELKVGALPTATFTFPVGNAAPGIFQYGANRAVVQNQDGSLNGPQTPAPAGSVIVVYLTGQGRLDNRVPTGSPAPAAPLSRAVLPASGAIGGRICEIFFLGLAPGFVGLAQANLRVPDLPPGDYPLVLTVGGVASPPATVTVAATRN